MTRRPVPEGYGMPERVVREMKAHTMKLSSAATLADLAKDYAIFNHGTFFIHGKLDVDPVADFVARHPDPDVQVMPTTFGRRIFHGLSAPGRRVGPPLDWDRVLVFVAHAHADDLLDYLRNCAWVDRRRRAYGRAVVQHIPVVDFLALDKACVVPAPLPVVEVVAFGVDGTNVHVQFTPRVAHPLDVATAVHLPLRAETGRLGAALLSGDPRPFRFVESEDPFADESNLPSTA